jgi:hypothetical protein
VTSNRRVHRLAAFTAISVLFAVTSTVSALASSGTVGSQVPAAAPAAAVVVATSEYAPSESMLAKAARPPYVAPAAPAKPAPVAKPVAVTKIVTVAARVVAKPAPKPAAKPKATVRPVVRRAAPVAAARVVTTRTITISRYVDAPGSQKAIDACNLVLWAHAPLWLAAHNYCGYQWLATVPTGTTVRVTKGAAAGTFVVTGHVRLNRQGGVMPALRADLVLQTCVGTGTGLTLLRRV